MDLIEDIQYKTLPLIYLTTYNIKDGNGHFVYMISILIMIWCFNNFQNE